VVVDDFEGEADPSKMSLGMKKWNWVRSEYNDGRVVTPKMVDKFTLTFNTDGTFGASTDCNGVGGNYTTKEGSITFSQMISTLMYCEGSQENEFRDSLSNSTSYHFTSKGELVLGLKFDSGSVIFR
jgi:heat shock protein HslJ